MMRNKRMIKDALIGMSYPTHLFWTSNVQLFLFLIDFLMVFAGMAVAHVKTNVSIFDPLQSITLCEINYLYLPSLTCSAESENWSTGQFHQK